MKFSEYEKHGAGRLAEAATHWLTFMEKYPEYLEKKRLEAQGPPKGYFAVNPWPTFISPQIRDQLKEAALSVVTLNGTILSRIFGNSVGKISEYYGMSPAAVSGALAGATPQYIQMLLARSDLTLAEDGRVQCLENNVASNIGGGQHEMGCNAFIRQPVIQKFLEEHNLEVQSCNMFDHLLDHLFACVLETPALRFRHRDDINITVCMVEPPKEMRCHRTLTYFNRSYRLISREMYDGRFKGHVSFAVHPFSSFSVRNGMLYNNNHPVHVLLNYAGLGMPPVFRDMINDGRLFVLNDAVTGLLCNKMNLALLSEHQDSPLYSQEERGKIKKYVPWTRRVKHGTVTYEDETHPLETLIKKNRSRLVLKPGTGMGGKGICCGFSVDDTQWQTVLNTAFTEGDWVVQEYVKPVENQYQLGENGAGPHQLVWGVFVFGKRYGGQMLRLLDSSVKSGIINVSQGAEFSVPVVVQPKHAHLVTH